MQSFYGYVKFREQVEEVVEKRALLGGSQDRIPEHTGCHGLQVAEFTFIQFRTVVNQVEPFEFLRSKYMIPGIESLLRYFLQQAAGAYGQVHFYIIVAEVCQEKRKIIFPRNTPEGGGVYHRGGIGIPGVPSCELNIVVRSICRIPSKHYVTKSKSLFDA